MQFRNSLSFFLFCLLFCFLCSCIKCSRTLKISTGNPSEEVSTDDQSEELPTNSSSDEDDDDDEEQDDALLINWVVFLAIWIPCTGFAITCIVAGISKYTVEVMKFVFLGIVVSTQWPYPNFCCWTQAMTDRSNGCCEFSLYRMNLLLALTNMLIFIVIYIYDWTILLAIPATFFIWHYIAIALLRRQFHRFGWPLSQENAVEARSVRIGCLIMKLRCSRLIHRSD